MALEDEAALTMRDPFTEQEERWVTLGMDASHPVDFRAIGDSPRAA